MAKNLPNEQEIFINNESMCEDTLSADKKIAVTQSKNKDGFLSSRCSVCHNIPKPKQVRTYYGHRFCHKCFQKYIWSPPKPVCSGDMKLIDMTLLKENCEICVPSSRSSEL